MCEYAHSTVFVRRSEDKFQELVRSIHCRIWELNSGHQVCTASTFTELFLWHPYSVLSWNLSSLSKATATMSKLTREWMTTGISTFKPKNLKEDKALTFDKNPPWTKFILRAGQMAQQFKKITSSYCFCRGQGTWVQLPVAMAHNCLLIAQGIWCL